MKSAYELAMERLNKTSPTTPLTGEQKKEVAELDSLYAAKIAEREIFLNSQIAKAEAKGAWEELEELKRQLARDKKSLNAELEEKKQKVRDKK